MNIQELYDSKSFSIYYDMLCEWNNKFNLTSLTSREDIYLKHFYDSVLPAELFPLNSRVLDIGSGAGFPGICLKLIRPDLDITLLDSVGKKITFLQAVITELSLDTVQAKKCRIEDFTLNDFDIVTARAVAPSNVLAEYCIPFTRLNGFTLFYKAADIEDEITTAKKAISFLGGKIEAVYKKALSPDIIRSFVLIRKVAKTPVGYPRKGNKPRLSPL